MKGVQYLIDEKGNKTAVLIDLKKNAELWEDFFDLALSSSPRGRTSGIPGTGQTADHTNETAGRWMNTQSSFACSARKELEALTQRLALRILRQIESAREGTSAPGLPQARPARRTCGGSASAITVSSIPLMTPIASLTLLRYVIAKMLINKLEWDGNKGHILNFRG